MSAALRPETAMCEIGRDALTAAAITCEFQARAAEENARAEDRRGNPIGASACRLHAQRRREQAERMRIKLRVMAFPEPGRRAS